MFMNKAAAKRRESIYAVNIAPHNEDICPYVRHFCI